MTEKVALHTTETLGVIRNDCGRTTLSRVRVSGGWLYMLEGTTEVSTTIAVHSSMQFVPDSFDYNNAYPFPLPNSAPQDTQAPDAG